MMGSAARSHATRHRVIASLRRLAFPSEHESCEICHREIAAGHAHLWSVTTRRIACCCDACASTAMKSDLYRRIGPDIELLSGLTLSDAQWSRMGVPIGLAFFVRRSSTGQVTAVYPSPAGALESDVSEAWRSLEEVHPVLRTLKPDVEALLVQRLKGDREFYRIPIDRAFHLAGMIRLHWQGFSGGPRMWDEVEAYFARLREEVRA